MQFAETGKVDVIKQDGAGLVHLLHIHSSMQLVGKLMRERILTGRDMILIGTRGRIKSGMGIGPHRHDPIDRDVFGQYPIHLLC